MSSIIISTDFPYMGEQIAPKLADALGYEYLGPQFLDQVASDSGVSKDRLMKALNSEACSWVSGRRNSRLQLSCLKAAVWERFLSDNIVCEGLGAHLYIRGVSHVLTVRLLSDPKLVANRIAAEKVVAPKRARKILDKRVHRRRHWSRRNFGLDDFDPSIYDMVLSLSQIEEDKAVEVIKDMAGYRKFQPMTYSLQCTKDGALAARIEAALLLETPHVKIQVRDGNVILEPGSLRGVKGRQAEKLKELAYNVPGVEYVEIHNGKNFAHRPGNSS
jgi:cytidylate kinase